jgi:hypothetical protein
MNIEEAYPIQLIQDDECPVCGKEFKFKKRYYANDKTPEGLYEVIIATNHIKCDNLQKQLQKAKAKVLDLEFELFCKRFSECKYGREI